MIERIKAWYHTRNVLNVQEFAQRHRNFLVIVCDPRDDTMFMSYRGKQISAKIKSQDGIDHKVLKNVLKYSTFEREIDRFLGGVLDALKSPMVGISNTFYAFLDGGVHAIALALRKKDKRK